MRADRSSFTEVLNDCTFGEIAETLDMNPFCLPAWCCLVRCAPPAAVQEHLERPRGSIQEEAAKLRASLGRAPALNEVLRAMGKGGEQRLGTPPPTERCTDTDRHARAHARTHARIRALARALTHTGTHANTDTAPAAQQQLTVFAGSSPAARPAAQQQIVAARKQLTASSSPSNSAASHRQHQQRTSSTRSSPAARQQLAQQLAASTSSSLTSSSPPA